MFYIQVLQLGGTKYILEKDMQVHLKIKHVDKERNSFE